MLGKLKTPICVSFRSLCPIVSREISRVRAIIVLFFVIGCCKSYVKTDAQVVVGFRVLRGAFIVVPVFVGDKGPFDFILDTAGETSLIDSTLARKLEPARPDSVPLDTPNGQQNASLVIVPSLSVGSLVTTQAEILETDLRPFSHSGLAIMGVLGEDVLSQFNLLLDYRNRSVAFYAKTESQSPIAGSHLPISIAHACPFVIAELPDGRTLRLFLDSGANSLVLHNIHIPEFHPCSSSAGYPCGSSAHGGMLRSAAGISKVIQGHITGLRIGDVYFPDVAAVISPQALPDDPVNGDLPLSLFRQVYINFSERYAVIIR